MPSRRTGRRWTNCASPSKKTSPAAEQDRPDIAERRAAWRVTPLGLDPARLVFVDETWAKTSMTRLYGRALRGARVVEKVPHGHWKTTTLIAVLDCHGIRCGLTLDGAVDGAAFESFVGQLLAPSLRPGDLVILDNLSSHKGPRVGELIRSVNANVPYLPPYSPDFKRAGTPKCAKWCQTLRKNRENDWMAAGFP